MDNLDHLIPRTEYQDEVGEVITEARREKDDGELSAVPSPSQSSQSSHPQGIKRVYGGGHCVDLHLGNHPSNLLTMYVFQILPMSNKAHK